MHQAHVLTQGGLQLLKEIVGGQTRLVTRRPRGLGLVGREVGRRQRFGISAVRLRDIVTHLRRHRGLTGGGLAHQLGPDHGVGEGNLAIDR